MELLKKNQSTAQGSRLSKLKNTEIQQEKWFLAPYLGSKQSRLIRMCDFYRE